VIYLSVGIIGVMVCGVIMILLSLRYLITGRNYGGLLGRGITRSDSLRLKRAPGMYFRAIGAVSAAAGLLLVWCGLALDFADKLPAGAVQGHRRAFAVILIGAPVLLMSLVGSAAWMMVLAKRYRLFRWDPP